MMLGIELSELIDLLSRNHEVEFTWKDMGFVIQPANDHLVLYRFSPSICDICKVSLEGNDLVGENAVMQILNEKCLGGHSFLELQHEIHVDVVQ